MAYISAIIVAGGSSNRMGGEDKLLMDLCGETPLERAVGAFERSALIDEIVIAARADAADRVKALCGRFKKVSAIVCGGKNRFFSTQAGVEAANKNADYYAIHDAARPLVSDKLIERVIAAAMKHGAAAPGVPLADTVKVVGEDGEIVSTPDRNSLAAISTPQVFEAKAYRAAAKGQSDALDDCQLFERAGRKVFVVAGDKTNIKLTTPEDIDVARTYLGGARMRIGHGYDVHRLAEGRRLVLGGADIPFEKGLLGHSDADVLVHAVMDALVGAAALGDIGKLFPDTDASYAGISSLTLLERVKGELDKAGFRVVNVDATVVCERPKLRGYIDAMRDNVARALKTDVESISIKATTEEGLGFTGTGEGIAAHAVALIIANGA